MYPPTYLPPPPPGWSVPWRSRFSSWPTGRPPSCGSCCSAAGLAASTTGRPPCRGRGPDGTPVHPGLTGRWARRSGAPRSSLTRPWDEHRYPSGAEAATVALHRRSIRRQAPLYGPSAGWRTAGIRGALLALSSVAAVAFMYGTVREQALTWRPSPFALASDWTG